MSTLIKWSSNWADEMDVEGFVIVNDEDLQLFKENLEKINRPFYVYIGTNEEIGYDKVEHLKRELEFMELSEQQEKILRQIFNYDRYGFTSFYYRVMDWEE